MSYLMSKPNLLDYNILVRDTEIQSNYYVQFGTNKLGRGMKHTYHFPYGLDSTTSLHLQG